MRRSNTLVELYHAGDASAVEVFARDHNSNSPTNKDQPQETYRALIPSENPRIGEQFAFQVDLDSCSACKSCVSACHHMNGLSDEESWRRVSQWFGEKQEDQWIQTITSACHHCVNPECMNGCPVGAYEKDSITGIVKHLDDQCIGCEYCIWKCPYEVPRYHEDFGIVRKCDMCSERLNNQLEPACVQACPHDAIRIGIASQEDLIHSGKSSGMEVNELYPGAPDSEITIPSSSYQTNRTLRHSKWAAVDSQISMTKPHWPLVWMLILTQWGVGILTAHLILAQGWNGLQTSHYASPFWIGTWLILSGLGASYFHLGQPTKAWRFFLGLKTSWLSREILLFSTLAGCLGLGCLDAKMNIIPQTLKEILACATVMCGWLSVFTSAMIYHDTHRPAWAIQRTGLSFIGSIFSGAVCCTMLVIFSNLESFTSFMVCVILVFQLLLTSFKTKKLMQKLDTSRDGVIRSNFPWVISALLICLLVPGIVNSVPWLLGTASVLSIGWLFAMDLVGRKMFFLQSKPPVAEPTTGGKFL